MSGQRSRGLVALRVVLALTALGTLPQPAAASGGEGTWLGLPVWVWLLANMVIFWGLLIRFLGPVLKKFFQERREEIGQSMATAREQQRSAESMRAELDAKLDEIRQDIDALGERSQTEAKREAEEILQAAQEESERILAHARDEIDRGVERARAELTRHTAELAARLAQERLASELGPEDRKRLFADGIGRLERLTR